MPEYQIVVPCTTTAKHLIISLYRPAEEEVIISRRAGPERRVGRVGRADIVVALMVSEGPCEAVEAGSLTAQVQVEGGTLAAVIAEAAAEPASQTLSPRLLTVVLWCDIS